MSARAVALLILVAALATAPGARAGLQVTLVVSNRVPTVGEAVRTVIRIEPAQTGCRMRLLAAAPRVDIQKALDTLVNRPAPRLGFFVPLTRTGAKNWRGTVRFRTTGLWKLVVPNWCARGYVLPLPIVQRVSVRPR